MNEKDVLFYIKSLDLSILRKMMIGKDIKNSPSPTQIRIICFMVDHQNEDIYQKTIEKHLNLSRSTVSDVLKTMEKNNYITKIQSLDDARTNRIILNKETLEFHRKMQTELHKINDVIQNNISNEDLAIFIKVAKQMQENLKK